MIAGIFLCFVAIGMTFGAFFYGVGSTYLTIAILPAAGLALGMVTLADRNDTDATNDEVQDV